MHYVIGSTSNCQNDQCCCHLEKRQHSSSRDLGAKISGLMVAGAEWHWQGLTHSRMQQILQKCSEYSKTGYMSRLVGCGSMGMDNSLNSLLALFQKMYCIIGFELVCVIPNCFMQTLTATSAKVSVLVSSFFKKVFTTTLRITYWHN